MSESQLPQPSIAPAPLDTDPWEIVNYERGMLVFLRHLQHRVTYNIEGDERIPPHKLLNAISNVLCEATVLHVRQLCEILLSDGSKPDSIRLTGILKGFTPPSLRALDSAYGKSANEKSYRAIFNKHCMHPSSSRGTSFSYGPAFDAIIPLIEAVLDEVDQERTRRTTPAPTPLP